MQEETTVIKTYTDDAGNIDIKVTSEIETEDRLLAILLIVLEQMTGVSTDNYIDEVDAKRAA